MHYIHDVPQCCYMLVVSLVSLNDPNYSAYLPISHSLTLPFLTYSTSNKPPPSPGPNCVTLALSSFSFLLSAFLFDLSASVSQSSSNLLAALLARFSAFSSSLSVGEGVRRSRILGISMGSSYNPGDLFRGYLSASTPWK
jgi:hypothetical protein